MLATPPASTLSDVMPSASASALRPTAMITCSTE